MQRHGKLFQSHEMLPDNFRTQENNHALIIEDIYRLQKYLTQSKSKTFLFNLLTVTDASHLSISLR